MEDEEFLNEEADESISDYEDGIRECDYCGSEVDLEEWREQGGLCEECYEEDLMNWQGVR